MGFEVTELTLTPFRPSPSWLVTSSVTRWQPLERCESVIVFWKTMVAPFWGSGQTQVGKRFTAGTLARCFAGRKNQSKPRARMRRVQKVGSERFELAARRLPARLSMGA